VQRVVDVSSDATGWTGHRVAQRKVMRRASGSGRVGTHSKEQGKVELQNIKRVRKGGSVQRDLADEARSRNTAKEKGPGKHVGLKRRFNVARRRNDSVDFALVEEREGHKRLKKGS